MVTANRIPVPEPMAPIDNKNNINDRNNIINKKLKDFTKLL